MFGDEGREGGGGVRRGEAEGGREWGGEDWRGDSGEGVVTGYVERGRRAMWSAGGGGLCGAREEEVEQRDSPRPVVHYRWIISCWPSLALGSGREG